MNAGRESNLGKGGLLGSDKPRQGAGSESRLGSGGLLGSDQRRLSAAQEIARNFEQKLAQQNVASAADLLAKVTDDNGDGTFDVELAAGGGTMRAVPAQQSLIVFTDAWYTLQRQGPGWMIASPSPYGAG